ncbi:NIPSNAP family protein [Nocardia crassostreae]|uniref:NIPSNAP family protein n=1 Tax=Nocardia crassostreae TaxID=53428 RepID=UPI000836EE59|nr:NIPSNAP family protein [Nocardia crassostreae]
MVENPWPVVELRQYTLRPGTRDIMIDLFDRELVETQEAVGMRIAGQFRDESNPDRFVWMRAFPDIPARTASLTAFYIDGPVWREHAPAARATMVDTDNALLLRPATADSAFDLSGQRPPARAVESPQSRALATIYYPAGDPREFAEFFDDRVRPALGMSPIGCYRTDPTPNDFTRLPVRTETVFAWFALFPDADARTAALDALAASRDWTERVLPELGARSCAPAEQLLLAPTSRSLLR